MTIGQRIKEKRIELGLSQDELAKKCGYKSRSSINKIELARDLPLRKIEVMAKALGVSPGYLMGWVIDTKPTDSEERHLKRTTAYAGKLILDVKNSPDIRQLVEDFMKLTPPQKESVLALVHNMIPNKHQPQ